MNPITQADLVFKPLPHAPFILNAVVKVNDHFQLSISKNQRPGLWYVGEDGSYEVAVQAFETFGTAADLVHLPHESDNVVHDCDLKKINALAAEAEKLTYVGKIQIYDFINREVCPDGNPVWFSRFYCAAGKDLKKKETYAKMVWPPSKLRFIPA